jgi:hypothetical protein
MYCGVSILTDRCFTAGEVCERVNAWLAPLGVPTKYMYGTNREARIERAVLQKTVQLDNQLHLLLVEMTLRVDQQLVATAEELCSQEEQLQALLQSQPSSSTPVSSMLAAWCML